MEYKAILLDMDGLMFDTERMSDEIWMEICAKEKYPVTPMHLKHIRGQNKQGCKNTFTNFFGNQFPYDDITAQIRDRMEAQLNEHVPIKTGLVEFLQAAHAKGIPMAVASSTNRDKVIRNLKKANVEQYIDVIVGGDEIENSKPSPDIFILAAQRLGVKAEDCIAFEDSYNGVKSANAAGCYTVMIPDREPADAEMKRLSSYIVENLNEAISLI